MNITQGNLVVVGAETYDPHFYWKGQEIPGVVECNIDWEPDVHRVKLRVRPWETEAVRVLYAELRIHGISVKEVKGE